MLQLLKQLSSEQATRQRPTIVGITGSWGLALTKQALAHILQNYTDVATTPDGAVHHADVLTDIAELLSGEASTIVAELPLIRPGQVDQLAGRIPFSVAIVTNIHTGRLEYFQTRELAAHEALSLPTSLSESGVAVLNFDEPLLASAADNLQARVIGYGASPAADVRISRLEPTTGGGYALELRVAGQFIEGRLPHLATRLQAQAVVGAIAAAFAITRDVGAVAGGLKTLQTFAPPTGYGTKTGAQGITTLADTFDATPESMEAGLRQLAQADGRKIAVLGDLAELGGSAAAWYQQIGPLAAQYSDVAIFVGEHMRVAQASALTSQQQIDTHHFESSLDVGKWISDYLKESDTVFLAGSREMQLESILEHIKSVV